MKFCKKCRKRIVEKLENGIDLVKICTCRGRVSLVHNSVVKRRNSEIKWLPR